MEKTGSGIFNAGTSGIQTSGNHRNLYRLNYSLSRRTWKL